MHCVGELVINYNPFINYNESLAGDAAPIDLTIPVGTISSSSLALSWFLPVLARPADINITNFRVIWARLGDSTPPTTASVTLTESRSDVHGYTITGLEPSGSYDIEVVVVYSIPVFESAPTSMIIDTLSADMSKHYTHTHTHTRTHTHTHTAPPPLIPRVEGKDDPIFPVAVGTILTIRWNMPTVPFIRLYTVTYSATPFTSRRRRQTESFTMNTTGNTPQLDIPDFLGGATYGTDIDAIVGAPGAMPLVLDVLPDDAVFTAPDTGGCGLWVWSLLHSQFTQLVSCSLIVRVRVALEIVIL